MRPIQLVIFGYGKEVKYGRGLFVLPRLIKMIQTQPHITFGWLLLEINNGITQKVDFWELK